MNPPSALNSAMSRDRKPFTYTPGGLDLSEIKSQRMAQRLMRNAMNQGVPETPVHPVHSQPNAAASVKLPNFNCLPVQVFPTFNLPANPKSLLRTRSDPRETPIQRIVPSTVNSTRFENNHDSFNNNNNKYTPAYSQVNNNRPVSMYEYTAPPAPAPVNTYSLPRTNYGSDGYTSPVLPEISYEAEYFRAPPRVYSATEQLPKLEISEEKDKIPVNKSVDSTVKPFTEMTFSPVPTAPKAVSGPIILPSALVSKVTRSPTPITPKEVNIPTIDSTPSSTNEVLPSSIEPEEVPSLTTDSSPVVLQEETIPTTVPSTVETQEVTTPTITPTSEATNEVNIPNNVPTPEVTKEVTIPMTIPTSVLNEVTIPTISSTPILTKPVEENAGTDNEQVQLKLLYTYYVYIYMSVYVVCYTYLLYNITEL